jgi:hypothetical protein
LKKDLPASDYWPRSFSMKKKNKVIFEKGATLGEEMLIDFNL